MIGVVLAGGASRRFDGRPKGLIPFANRAMALRAADVLLQVCARVVIEAPRNAGYEALGLALIHAPPEHIGKGPLSALAAGLASPNAGRVAFAPCDMPLLDASIYRTLAREAGEGPGVYAETAVGFEPLVAVLDTRIGPELLRALAGEELPRTHAVLDGAGVRPVWFDRREPFENVNTPADLDRLARMKLG
jgi:molybdopterin-guanine dinucleotide biosynthesis protein A